jgi:NADPH:quinone reductase
MKIRAAGYAAMGGHDVLRIVDLPVRDPDVGEVRVRIHYSGVNPTDWKTRSGATNPKLYAEVTPGLDGAGVIDAVGPGVTRWKPGERVAAAGVMPLEICGEDERAYKGPRGMMGIKRPGGFAELVCIPSCAVDRLPDGLGFAEAAVVLRHCPTAWNLLVNIAQLKPQEWVLVMGAGGNLGSVGIQIAKNVIGARVIATAGSDERVKMGLALGADHGINYRAKDICDEVLRTTGGKGVDVLYDNIANPEVLPKAFHAIGMNGRLVTAGAHAGPNVSIDFFHLYDRRITVRGCPGHERADIPKCFQAAVEGKIKVQIARIMPLSQAAEAHRLMEGDPGMGKIILDPTLS